MPSLEALLRHLSECPDIFLQAPKQGAHGTIHVGALVSDLLWDKRKVLLAEKDVAVFSKKGANHRNYLRQVQICCWLFSHNFFQSRSCDGDRILTFLKNGLTDLSRLVDADQLVSDPDRREELVRLCLKAVGKIPAGETKAQAQDRLGALDSVERQRVIKATQDKLEHARELKKAMEAKAAAEAASRYHRE